MNILGGLQPSITKEKMSIVNSMSKKAMLDSTSKTIQFAEAR